MTLHICQSDLARISDADRVLGDIAAFGFQRVRFEVPFDMVYAKPAPSWGSVEKLAALFAKHGLQTLPVLGAHLPLTWRPTSSTYAKFCADAVSILNPDKVELWNEPNLINFWPKADPATFYSWAQAGYDAVMSPIEVILGGMAAAIDQFTGFWKFLVPILGGNKSPETFLAGLHAKAGGRKFYDRIGYHPYSLDGAFKQVTPSLGVMGISKISTMRNLGPLVFTEVGFAGSDNAVRTSLLSAQMGLPPMLGTETYLYCWRDAGGERYGLVDIRNRPREPYYSAVKALI